MAFAIPLEKVLLSRYSVCLGITHFEVLNGTERMEQNSAKTLGLTEQPTQQQKIIFIDQKHYSSSNAMAGFKQRFLKVIRVFFFFLELFGTSFQKCFKVT
jgi:hypothetical protein